MPARTVVILLAILLVSPAAALAQSGALPPPQPAPSSTTNEGFDNYVSIYYNLNFGGQLFKDLEDLDAHSGSQGFGFALTFWGRGKFSAEVDLNYNPKFYDSGADVGSNNAITLTMSAIIGPWINQGGSQRVRPYFVVGGGLMRSSFSDFADVGWKTTENIGVVDVGGGLIYFFHPRVGIRGDIRYRYGVGANDTAGGWGWVSDRNYWRGAFGASFAF
jgi:hypothetical protein